MPAMTSRKTLTAKLAGAVMIIAAAAPACAQSLSHNNSCIKGQVLANDYAELSASFQESTWDNSAGVELISDNTQMQLVVVDEYDNSICDDTANMRTRCQFSVRTGGTFKVKVDNSQFLLPSGYKLCAF